MLTDDSDRFTVGYFSSGGVDGMCLGRGEARTD